MECIKVFISFSSEEKQIAGSLKYYLETYCGYSVFVAHDDIRPSTDFKDEIIKAIESCDFFIPLISFCFSNSSYTDQELGMALALKKQIIPIKLDKNPYGFIADIQALRVNITQAGYIQELSITIGIMALRDFTGSYNKKAKNSICMALKNSSQFKNSNAIINMICKSTVFDKTQLAVINEAINNNSQVRGAFGLSYLEKMLTNNYGKVVENNN